MDRMKKIAVTGAQGFLGARLCQYFKNSYEVTGLSRQEFDITSESQTDSCIDRCRPDYVIHCAAVSDTGYAQEHPQESYAVNVTGSVNLARSCRQTGAKLIYMSSDQVYTGCPGPGSLAETVRLAPENEYGRQKLEEEERIKAILPEAVGLRLTWMYDLPNRGFKTNSNLIWNIMKAMLYREPLFFRDFEYRGITYVWEVARRMEQIMSLPGGVYNCGSENDRTAYETAQYTAKQLGCQDIDSLIKRLPREEGQPVRNLAIDTKRMRENGICFPDTLEGIELCITEYGLEQEI